MSEYALVGPNDEIKTYSVNVDPNVKTREGWRWIAVTNVQSPLPPDSKYEAPVIAVDWDAQSVTRSWPIRAFTPEELEGRLESRIDQIDVLALKLLFNHENRIRAMESKPPITQAQFRAALKGML